MKYMMLVSHGTFAPGLHNALSMLAGEGREDILSTSLENGRGSVSVVKDEDELILFGDLIGGSPLTTAANVIAEKGLLSRTRMIGGMNLPLVLTAALMKDSMETEDLVGMLQDEAKDAIKEFCITTEENEDDI